MEGLHLRCAALDVHKDSVVAAVRLAEPGGVRCEVRRFDATTPGLLALGEWLAECGGTHAAMEATGVYRKPVRHVLSDGERVLTLANAAHVKNVLTLANAAHVKNGPGRKADVADAAWLAGLLAHGLVRAVERMRSTVPDAPTQAMRALRRTRKRLARERASHVRRPRKTPEDADLKLASVPTDVMGLSGRGPGRCPEPSRRRSPARPTPTGCPPWRIAGSGPGRRGCGPRWAGASATAVASCSACTWAGTTRWRRRWPRSTRARSTASNERGLGPFRDAVRLLRTVPGIGDLAARAIVAEIGSDMRRFPTAAHPVSWAGLRPRNAESAGRRRSTRLRKGAHRG